MSNGVPVGWSLKPLSSLANYYNGRAFKPEDWSSEGLPIIRIAQINNPSASIDRYAGDDILDKNLIRNGDLLFSWSATLTALIWDRGDAVLNQHIFKVEEKDFVNRDYLHQLILNSIDGLADHSHGSTMKHIKKSVLDEFFVPLPAKPEQQKIASILSSVDDVIEKTQAQIDKLKDLKAGLMQELLTKGIGHTEFKDSPVGRIPVGWDVVPISEHVLETRSGASLKPSDFSNEGVEVIPKKAVQFGGILVIDKKTYCTHEFAEANQKNWVDRDWLVTVLRDLVPTGPSIGLIVEIDRDSNFLMAQGVYGFKLDSNLHGGYLAQLSNSDWYRGQMRKILVGSTQVHIRSSEFFEMLIPKPPIGEQIEIYKALSSVDIQVLQLSRKVASFKYVKKALMQDLLTGKVRVKLDKECV